MASHHERRSGLLAYQRADDRAGGLLIPAAGRRRGDHDVLDARRQAESLGGKTVMPPTGPMEGTTIALFADPEGHVVGLVKPGPPPEG